MAIGGDILPVWLLHWLKVPFYEEKCSNHDSKYMTIYCSTCMVPPSCELCWKTDKNEHHLHCQILRVLRASERTAIKLSDIQQFWDASQIQIYSINSKPILHLMPNLNAHGESSTIAISRCHTCHRKLMDSIFCFCSIACKVNSIIDNRTVQMQIEDIPDLGNEPGISRSRRKGIPQRAPLK
ncbi:hypothetical protein CASFOL_011756 [Castilleja foliolosa]|uniref:Uncharacterized protein n=1 Tax=Castilleja foliolosa TaxID=1961234 RepID=A0ABD3DSI7_9LAMI